MPSQRAVSALNRFGLGAKPGELHSLGEPRAWLLGQLTARADAPATFAALPTSRDYLQREFAYNRERAAAHRSQRMDTSSADATNCVGTTGVVVVFLSPLAGRGCPKSLPQT